MAANAQARREARWLTPGQKKLLLACTATVGVVAAYKVYRSERLKATHQALQTAADTLAKYSDAASSVGQVAAVIAHDINAFLASDSDEVPRSLRQLAKLARCSDVQDTLAACVASSLKGVLSSSSGEPGEPSLVDKVIEAVLSDRGQTLVGLAVRTAAQQSTDTFCTALRQGLEAAMQGTGVTQQQQQGQQQQHPYSSPASPGAGGAFYSALSSPVGSPQQHVPYHVQTFTAYGSSSGLHPAVCAVLSVLTSPQLLQAVDGLVSTCVGSSVGAYMTAAGPSDNMLSSVLHTLSQPANKNLVIDIMSQVSATMCREMAAACVAPAAAVASSRPASRLSDLPSPMGGMYDYQQQLLQQQQQRLSGLPVRVSTAPPTVAAGGGSSSSSPYKQGPGHWAQDADAAAAALHHSVSEGAISRASGAADAVSAAGSEPSSPQSGPSTPEPSVAAADAQQPPARASYSSFAGSAVAGLILRRQSLSGLLGGGPGRGGSMQAAAAAAAGGSTCAGGPVLVDPSALGPMSTAVSLFVQAARFQEFRSLMVDVSRSSTREFVQSLLPSGWVRAVRGGGSSSGSSSAASLAVTAALQRVYTAVSVLILLMVYAVSPKMLMLQDGN